MKSFLTAGFALATCAAWAAVTENFDSGTAIPSSFTGGTIEAAELGSGATGNVLAYDSQVDCENDDNASASEFVKTTFKVLAPADGTEVSALPTGTEVSGCQIAVATGPEATDSNYLKVYVYARAEANTDPAWTDTGLTVAKEQYFSATLNFDYSKATKTATLQIGNAEVGPYTLVTSPSTTTSKINSLAFVGSSKLDEVKIDEAIAQSSLPENLDGLQIYASELPSGVTAQTLAENNGDNNYAKRIEAGLAVSSDAVAFKATSLATTEGNTVISVPCDKDYGQVYQVVINDGSATTTTVSATPGDIEGGARALTFTVPSTLTSKVLKFQVKVGVL